LQFSVFTAQELQLPPSHPVIKCM